ncbi:MAG: hypothetical protein ACYDDU_17140 [Dermatophilaceae bacterium]
MRIEWTSGFDRFLTRLEEAPDDEITKAQFDHLAALLGELRYLPAKPDSESATFKRARQARRHELWRVAHPYHPDVAVRVIVWFPSDQQAVVAVFGFDKAKLGDVWYGRAVVEGEANVDEWIRQYPEEREPNER